MADIRPEDVKRLRELTGSGMLDCKNALAEANGDIEQAQTILRKKGLAAATKRSGRATNEGKIFLAVNGSKAAIMELSCETDFVSRNENFLKIGNELVAMALAGSIQDPQDAKLQDKLKEAISVIKENMLVKRITLVNANANELLVQYVHGGGTIGVLVKIGADKAEVLAKNEVKEFAFDVALHVAAFNPQFLSKDTVDAKYIKDREEVFMTQAKATGKPDNVIAGIAKGKMSKHFTEICLLQQPFVKDDKKSVEEVMAAVSKTAGGKLSIAGYTYYRVGEEI